MRIEKVSRMKHKSLLTKAIAARWTRTSLTAADYALVMAWARGEVETYQVAAAKDFRKKNAHVVVYHYVADTFSQMVRQKVLRDSDIRKRKAERP